MMDCPALPKGWKREEIMRKCGLSAGRTDVFYFSPNGLKFRSKPQMARYLGDRIDLSTFDYRSGKINSILLRKSRRQRGTQFDYARGVRNDASLVPPIRQTASIFKQPVTIIKTQQDSKSKPELKHGLQEKPKQVFWEKRLQHLTACDLNEKAFHALELPRNLRGVGPNVEVNTILQSIATALHVSSQAITGQSGSKSVLEKNPGVFLNTEQPLVMAMIVGEEDIRRQEDRVKEARNRLKDVLDELE